MKANMTSRVIFNQIRNKEYSTPQEFLALCKALEFALAEEGRLYASHWHKAERRSTSHPKLWNRQF